MTIKLYDGQRSPNARKVRLLAAELGIELERFHPDFAKGELRSPEFLAKNPNGKIPTLDDDGFLLWESSAILRYLAAKRPDSGVVPSDTKQRALLDQWMFWWAAHPEAALLQLVVERLVKPFLGSGTPDASIVRDAEAALERYLPVLDKQLEGKDFILGNLSLIDFSVGPWLESAPRLGIEISRYPNLTALSQRLQSRPYWKDV